jgi:hypothetical protein
MKSLESQTETVILCLYKALAAPSLEEALKIAALADELGAGMTEAQKAYAIEQAEAKFAEEVQA